MRELVAQITSTSLMATLVIVAYVNSWLKKRDSKNVDFLETETIHESIESTLLKVDSRGNDNIAQELHNNDMQTDAKDVVIYHTQVPASTKMNVTSYAQLFGFLCKEYQTTTTDGFVLHVYRINRRNDHSYTDQSKTTPILLMHGLFQSSGVFVTSGIDSLAFVLAHQGYDVFLGNNRCVHKKHERHHPHEHEFWDWSLDELAKYDFPCLIDFVLDTTKEKQLFYIGHSQGTSQAFLGLKLDSSYSEKIKCFVALSPALYLGTLLQSPPISWLVNADMSVFDSIFGKREFVSLMCPAQRHLPASYFASIAYQMFSFLFGWSDRNWDANHKPAYFYFTPKPTSTKAIKHWFQLAKHGYLKSYSEALEMPEQTLDNMCTIAKETQSMSHSDSGILINNGSTLSQTSSTPIDVLANASLGEFDINCIQCPIIVFSGGKDEIVDANRLVEQFKRDKNHRLLYHEEIQEYEHLDVLWAIDAKKKVFGKMMTFMENC